MTRGLVDPEAVRRVSRTMALRKVARPEDVAAQVVALTSETISGHVTGQIVTVAGGMEGPSIHESTDASAGGHRGTPAAVARRYRADRCPS